MQLNEHSATTAIYMYCYIYLNIHVHVVPYYIRAIHGNNMHICPCSCQLSAVYGKSWILLGTCWLRLHGIYVISPLCYNVGEWVGVGDKWANIGYNHALSTNNLYKHVFQLFPIVLWYCFFMTWIFLLTSDYYQGVLFEPFPIGLWLLFYDSILLTQLIHSSLYSILLLPLSTCVYVCNIWLFGFPP